MPRRLPPYDNEFSRQVAFALSFIAHVEHARPLKQRDKGNLITMGDLEYTYELAFLRIFLAWENLLENSLLRLICGYSHSAGQEPLLPGITYYRTVADAEAAILGGMSYRLWHNPTQVIQYARRFLQGSQYELVIASASARITHIAAIRHRI